MLTAIDDLLQSLAHLSHVVENDDKQGQSLDEKLTSIRNAIIKDGDAAVLDCTKQFDKVEDPSFILKVTKEEVAAAYEAVSKEVVSALQRAHDRIRAFHKHQVPENWTQSPTDGVEYGNRFTAIEKVGLYVPGGRAAYPSSVLMNAIPAKLAGVSRPVLVSPPNMEGKLAPSVLVAADICGIDELYKVGGAQAIFALAHGTESIPKVDKIVGPGNIFVTKAKQMVYGLVDIDKPAGPSEVLVYCDQLDYARFAAAELLAQLEHDPLASAVVISCDETILTAVNQAVQMQLPALSRQSILSQSIQNGRLFLAKNEADAIACIDQIASEHLVLMTDNAKDLSEKITNAGAIFAGPYTPVALGDYCAGPNHVLPTAGAARFASPLGVSDFMKYSSYLSYSKDALSDIYTDLKLLTDLEGLDAHGRAGKERLTE